MAKKTSLEKLAEGAIDVMNEYIQQSNAKIEELTEQIKELKRENALLEQQLDAINHDR